MSDIGPFISFVGYLSALLIAHPLADRLGIARHGIPYLIVSLGFVVRASQRPDLPEGWAGWAIAFGITALLHLTSFSHRRGDEK